LQQAQVVDLGHYEVLHAFEIFRSTTLLLEPMEQS
jgi:hypothetical protein